MATFVLVHGAFHGGWCYRRVAGLLRAAGHEVFTPTLTGLGERAHLAPLSVNLSLHIEDVAAILRFEGLTDVILCGHSYGGMVITGVAAAIGDRIRTLVYLDAIVPQDGQSLFDIVGAEVAQRTIMSARADGKVPPPSVAFFNVNAADAKMVEALMTPQPLATFVEAVRFTGKEKEVRNRTYILANDYEFSLNREVYDHLRSDPSWRTLMIDAGHDLMIDAPEALARALVDEVNS